jgi:hypothetical protein
VLASFFSLIRGCFVPLQVQPLLKTDASGVAGFKGLPMLTSAGPVRAASLTNATIA